MTVRIINRKAPFENQLFDRLEAGISLLGSEVKSIKGGRAEFSGSFVRLKDGQAHLVNLHIPPYEGGVPRDYDPSRTRLLLLNRDEILSLETKAKQQKLTIVPVSVYTKGRLVKVQIALAKPKRKFEKREIKRRKDIQRDTERELKN